MKKKTQHEKHFLNTSQKHTYTHTLQYINEYDKTERFFYCFVIFFHSELSIFFCSLKYEISL